MFLWEIPLEWKSEFFLWEKAGIIGLPAEANI